jgi:cytochrome P450
MSISQGDWYQAFNLPDHRYVNQMSELDPKRHIAKAKNITSGYAFSNVIKSERYIDNAIQLLETQFDRLAEGHEPIHFDHWFNYFGFDVVGEVTFSKRVGFLDQGLDVRNAISNTRVLGIYIAFIGHMYWLHGWLLANPLIRWLNLKPSMYIFDTCLAALDARSKNDDVRKDMLEQWKEMRAKHPDRMEEKEILAAAVVNLGAGADTISATLQAFFYYLLRNKDALDKVRGEVDKAAGRGELSRIVSYAEAQKLPYLQACVSILV